MNSRTSLVIKSESEWLYKHSWKNEWPYPEISEDGLCFTKTFESLDSQCDITVVLFRIKGAATFEVGYKDHVYADLIMCEEDLSKIIEFFCTAHLNEIFVAMTMLKSL